MEDEPPSQPWQSLQEPTSQSDPQSIASSTSHALVIGGTGMLREATLELATHFNVVSVIARNSFRLNGLWEEAESVGVRVNPVQLDYRELDHLQEALDQVLHDFGEVTLVLAWIKNKADESISHLARTLNAQENRVAFYDLLTDIDYEEIDSDEDEREDLFDELSNIDYRQIILGVKSVEDVPKWFSNEEISAGVIEAIRLKQDTYRLGSTEDSAQA